MKRTLIVLFWCGLAVSLSSFAQEMPTWDLSRDLQISFTQGSNGVWYFMESASRVHDPALYRLLPRYLAPCQNAESIFAGVGCWQGTEDHIPDCFGAGCGLKTEVAFNFTSKPVPYQEALGSYVPHMARLMATWDRYAIVAWQSPLTGFVKVSARFGFQNIIGIGMDWSVDKGAVTLRKGHLFSENRQFANLSRVPIAKGDVLYFVVDNPWGSYYQPNPVDLRATVSQVP
jgi:hypothetical protein